MQLAAHRGFAARLLASAPSQQVAAIGLHAVAPRGRVLSSTCPFPASPPRAVNVKRYPLHDAVLSAPLLEQCRDDVGQNGYCHLPEFLLHEAVDKLVQEVLKHEEAGQGFRSFETHNILLEESGSSTKPNELRGKEFCSSKVLVAQDEMDQGSELLEVYHWEPLRLFLQSAFGVRRLFRSADPLGGAYYNIFDGERGDALGWHFDRSHFSMNLILQTTPGHGGDFQYVPDSREAILNMETWSEVEDYICPRLLTPALHPGSLYLFAGNKSLHQVSKVSRGKRINAIFTYVEEEGQKLNQYTLRKFFGRTGARPAPMQSGVANAADTP